MDALWGRGWTLTSTAALDLAQTWRLVESFTSKSVHTTECCHHFAFVVVVVVPQSVFVSSCVQACSIYQELANGSNGGVSEQQRDGNLTSLEIQPVDGTQLLYSFSLPNSNSTSAPGNLHYLIVFDEEANRTAFREIVSRRFYDSYLSKNA